MKIQAEGISQPIDVPDDATDEQIGSIVDAYHAGMHQQNPTMENLKSFGRNIAGAIQKGGEAFDNGIQNFAGGMGQSVERDLGIPIQKGLRAIIPGDNHPVLDKELGLEQADIGRDYGIPGKIGSVAGDVAISAPLMAVGGEAALAPKIISEGGPILRGIAGALGQGAGSAATHAIGDIGSGSGISPGKAIAETGISGILGGGGAVMGKVAKAVAPKILEAITNPSSKMLSSINPPTTAGFAKVLDRGLIPTEGAFNPMKTGFKAAADKVGDILSLANIKRGELMDQAESQTGSKGIYVPHMIGRARTALKADIADAMKGGVTPIDAQAAEKWFQDFEDGIKNNPKYKNGWIPASEAMKVKTSIGANTDFAAGDVPNAGRGLANKKLYAPFQQKTEAVMQGTPQETDFNNINRGMQEMSPIAEALRSRSVHPKSSGYLEGAADVGGITALLRGNPAGAVFPIYSMARRDPASAAVLYNAGKSLTSPSSIRDVLAQTGRSALFQGK